MNRQPASEDFLNFETVLLMGAGIGVTPFTSQVFLCRPTSPMFYFMAPFQNEKNSEVHLVTHEQIQRLTTCRAFKRCVEYPNRLTTLTSNDLYLR